MRIRAALALALMLAACERSPAADTYRFEHKEWQHLAPPITVVVHPSIAALRAAAPDSARSEGHILMAWSLINSGGCEVHIVDPAVSYQPEWLGHEVAHCLWGRWHA